MLEMGWDQQLLLVLVKSPQNCHQLVVLSSPKHCQTTSRHHLVRVGALDAGSPGDPAHGSGFPEPQPGAMGAPSAERQTLAKPFPWAA